MPLRALTGALAGCILVVNGEINETRIDVTLHECLAKVRDGVSLTEDEAANCLRSILNGAVGDEPVAALLVALAEKGETADEIAGFCRVLLENRIPVDLDSDCIDVCGTGGSGLSRFNVSTAVAFILAADGVPVAKHGNRGSRRPNGSFDLLDALDCPFEFRSDRISELFERTGLCFIYARAYHPLMKAVAGARKLANRRTIFNMAAPLCNPAEPAFQVVGTPTIDNARVLAEVLQRLDRRKCLVVTGAPGVDEVSVSGPTDILDVTPDTVQVGSLLPSELGIVPCDYGSIPGGDADVNAGLFLALIAGEGPQAILEMVCASGGVAMHCQGSVDSIRSGYQRCRDLLAQGTVAAKFHEFRSACQSLQL
ncbi:MAG: anthranilate phosphoribosyltransferase [Gemmatimonadetes bacterium]|jgi:anthranilate phosphoribosyltransferase|nr:anthranilate phosphoribosyltransferase [Gemmatimonadota bacterium]